MNRLSGDAGPRVASSRVAVAATALRVTLGIVAIPLLWWIVKTYGHVSDRYLPSIGSVFGAWRDIEPHPLIHMFYTASRFAIGFVGGVIGGVALGLAIFKWKSLRDLAMPSLQSSRAVPAIAVIPFFLLWFGFSEMGRYLLVLLGTAANVAIAVHEILRTIDEKFAVFFHSFGVPPESVVWRYALPSVIERLLPTLRFSLSTALGLIVASELLGSQVGLGYLIQTSRATFSLHVVVLAAILLGILNVAADGLLRYVWARLIYWS